MKKILIISIAFVGLLSAGEPDFSRTNGWYLGLDVSTASGSGSISDGSATIGGLDTKSTPITLKVGYLKENQDRVDIYYKKSNITWGFPDPVGDYEVDVSSYGLNYNITIVTLSNEMILPFVRLGFGFGSASSGEDDNFDSASVFELNTALGAYFKAHDKIDVTAAVTRTGVAIAGKNTAVLGAGLTGLELGVSYHF
jgi:hypothetical protein